MIQINRMESEKIKYLISLLLSAKYHLLLGNSSNTDIQKAVELLQKADGIIPSIIDCITEVDND